jgi:hypothetical protein
MLDRPVAPEMSRANSGVYSLVWKGFAMALTNPLTSSLSRWIRQVGGGWAERQQKDRKLVRVALDTAQGGSCHGHISVE